MIIFSYVFFLPSLVIELKLCKNLACAFIAMAEYIIIF
jgi:hypothetical protein